MEKEEESIEKTWEKELKHKSKEELIKEIIELRTKFSYLDPNVQYFLERIGSKVLLVRRDYHVYSGILLGTKWDLTHIEAGVFDKRYDMVLGKYVFEKKVVRIPYTGLVSLEFVEEQTPEEREEEKEKEKIEVKS